MIVLTALTVFFQTAAFNAVTVRRILDFWRHFSRKVVFTVVAVAFYPTELAASKTFTIVDGAVRFEAIAFQSFLVWHVLE